MTRMTGLNNPLLLGFDHLERLLDNVAKTSSDGYPPYNIEQIGEDRIRITLAVAGFSLDELEVVVEDSQLVVRGQQTDNSEGRIFLHRGIAARQFQRRFVLAEGIEVASATTDNGLLHVDLTRPKPETRTRTIHINAADGQAAKIAGD